MMADKRQWNVGLNAKGLEASVSEEQARRMCTTQGQTSVFIIEAHHGPFVTMEDGSIKMSLLIDQVELIPVEQEERVRRFKRALYLARPDQYGQQAFDMAADEPTVDDAGSQIDAVVETTEDGDPSGIWSPEAPEPTVDQGECAYPGCVLPIGHDEDHDYGDEPEEDVKPDNVVSFTAP